MFHWVTVPFTTMNNASFITIKAKVLPMNETENVKDDKHIQTCVKQSKPSL